ncbi:hypothetical protein [Stieleria sp.]|uniref:hypothetical protein n=1 Tax=Stieleria sp. TaxID=2795976 RepID=UPI0035667E90
MSKARAKIRKIIDDSGGGCASKCDSAAITKLAKLYDRGDVTVMDLVAVSGKALCDRVKQRVRTMKRESK